MRKTSLPPSPPPKKTLFPKFLLFLFFSSLIERRKRDSCVPTITLVVIQQTTISMKNKKTTLSTKPSRKTRTKTRKHKFISLRQELSQSNSPDSGQKMTHNHNHNHQLNLFPLHPENLFEEKDDNVSYFFDADDDGVTLNGVVFSDEDTLSPSLTYACGGQDSEEVGPPPSCLEKSALRHKERNDSEEEKWVCYSEVVEKKEEEVTSCISDYWSKNNSQRLSLKLDYQEIMNAWSDKGPLYIDVECPQIVPDVLDDTLRQDSSNVLVDVGNVGNVPQMMVLEDSNSTINGVDEEARKIGQREARVLRYKEKRRSRLFSKTIRYQVRKLNAEKRPRMKGRFVKRS